MHNRKRRIGILITLAAIVVVAVCLFAGRSSQVVEQLKKQKAALFEEEYIPNQNVSIENTAARQQRDSLYQQFRKAYRMHYQTMATASFADSSRLILIAEPAPFFSIDTLEHICRQFTHETVQKSFKIGYDGRVTDLAIVLANATTENLDRLIRELSQALYLSDYKPHALDLLAGHKRQYYSKENLDYQISLQEFDDWFFNAGEPFIDNKDTARTLTVSDMFKKKRKGVFFSKAPGLVAWAIRKNSDIGAQLSDIRRFALDADLILGALCDSSTLVVIGRERETSLNLMPPLRVESVLLLASISEKEISQSLDVNDFMAGKMSNGRDWCPTYLSKELENTEFGHLLTITDVLLKDWSESGTIEEASYHYPTPGYFPFDRPLFRKLGLSQLVYNWNTANTMYAIDLPQYTIYTLNRTGALPVSYFNSQERSQTVGHSYEHQASNYFARCGNSDIARVVQYVALYQLFMDNGVHYKGTLLPNVFPKNKPYLLAKPCRQMMDIFKNLTDAQIDDLADTLSRKQFKEYGESQVLKQMRQNEADYHFTYTEENHREIFQNVKVQQKSHIASEFRDARAMLRALSDKEFEQLARYLSYPRGTIVNNQERYTRMLRARQLNDLIRMMGKNNLPLLGFDLAKVRDYYVANLAQSGAPYLKTPSVIVTFNDFLTTGGHNISSRISRVSSTTNYKSSNYGSAPSQRYPAASAPSGTPAKPATTPATGGNAKPSTPATKSGTGARPTTSSAKPTTSAAAKTSTSAAHLPAGNVRPRTAVIPSGTRSQRGF